MRIIPSTFVSYIHSQCPSSASATGARPSAPPALFLILNVSGTVARLVLIMFLGEAFEAPINWVLGFISDYRIPLLIVSVTLVGLTVWNESRKGTSEIDQLRRLEGDLDDDRREEPGP